jgi:hypothetical protein
MVVAPHLDATTYPNLIAYNLGALRSKGAFFGYFLCTGKESDPLDAVERKLRSKTAKSQKRDQWKLDSNTYANYLQAKLTS